MTKGGETSQNANAPTMLQPDTPLQNVLLASYLSARVD